MKEVLPVDQTEKTICIIQYFKDNWLLLLIGATIAFFSAVTHIKQSYYKSNPVQCIINIIWSTGIGAIAVIITLALLNYIDVELTTQSEIAVSAYCGLVGMKVIDLILERKWNIKGSLMDPEYTLSQKKLLTPEQQIQHLKQCPFGEKSDECRGCTKDCDNCPKRRNS